MMADPGSDEVLALHRQLAAETLRADDAGAALERLLAERKEEQ
jgi:hypothetical protein